MQDAFHVRLRDTIQTPIDPDIAVSLGAVQAGLAENLVQRPTGAPTIIVPMTYVIGIGPNRATSSPSEGTRNSRHASAKLEVFEAQYLVFKGALLKKGVPCFETFTKTSRDSSDSLFIARLYSTDSSEWYSDTSDLEHILDWEIDLKLAPSFKWDVRKRSQDDLTAAFDIGIEVESRQVHAVWFYEGAEYGRVMLSPRFDSV